MENSRKPNANGVNKTCKKVRASRVIKLDEDRTCAARRSTVEADRINFDDLSNSESGKE